MEKIVLIISIILASTALNATSLRNLLSKEPGSRLGSLFLALLMAAVGGVLILILTGDRRISFGFGIYHLICFLILSLIAQLGNSRLTFPLFGIVVLGLGGFAWFVINNLPPGPQPEPTATLAPISTVEPTLTPTLLLEPTFTVTPLNIMGKITANDVNVRSGPGVEYEVMAKYNTGVELMALAKSTDEKWFVVSMLDGRLGWVSGDYFQVSGPMASLGIATAPPTPVVPTRDPKKAQCDKWHKLGNDIRGSYGKSRGDPGYDSKSDLNNDGTIDIVDIGIWVDRNPGGCT